MNKFSFWRNLADAHAMTLGQPGRSLLATSAILIGLFGIFMIIGSISAFAVSAINLVTNYLIGSSLLTLSELNTLIVPIPIVMALLLLFPFWNFWNDYINGVSDLKWTRLLKFGRREMKLAGYSILFVIAFVLLTLAIGLMKWMTVAALQPPAYLGLETGLIGQAITLIVFTVAIIPCFGAALVLPALGDRAASLSLVQIWRLCRGHRIKFGLGFLICSLPNVLLLSYAAPFFRGSMGLRGAASGLTIIVLMLMIFVQITFQINYLALCYARLRGADIGVVGRLPILTPLRPLLRLPLLLALGLLAYDVSTFFGFGPLWWRVAEPLGAILLPLAAGFSFGWVILAIDGLINFMSKADAARRAVSAAAPLFVMILGILIPKLSPPEQWGLITLKQDIARKLVMAAEATNEGTDTLGLYITAALAARMVPNYGHIWALKGGAEDDLDWQAAAIADLTRAISLGDLENGYEYRGVAWTHLMNTENALADYTAALNINPNSEIYFKRGQLYFALSNYQQAALDFAAAAQLSPNDAYTMLWAYVAEKRIGGGDAAKANLADRARALDPARWPYPIVNLYLGHIKSADVALPVKPTASEKFSYKIEKPYYLAEYALLQGDSTGATQLFRQALGTGIKGFTEYHAAESELAKLKTKP